MPYSKIEKLYHNTQIKKYQIIKLSSHCKSVKEQSGQKLFFKITVIELIKSNKTMKDKLKQKNPKKTKLKVIIRSIKNTPVKNRNWRDLTPSHECPCFLLIQALCKNQDIRKVIKYWKSKGREINQTFIPLHAKKLDLHMPHWY